MLETNRTLPVDALINQGENPRPRTIDEELRAEPAPIDEDVTQNDLTKMALPQLEGRLAYYDREATFERNPHARIRFKAEAQRTRIEINRRKMYQRAEAERVFAL